MTVAVFDQSGNPPRWGWTGRDRQRFVRTREHPHHKVGPWSQGLQVTRPSMHVPETQQNAGWRQVGRRRLSSRGTLRNGQHAARTRTRGREPYGFRRPKSKPKIRPFLQTNPQPTAGRFYQLLSGHATIAPVLKEKWGWVESDQCSRGRQSREHPFKECKRWKREITTSAMGRGGEYLRREVEARGMGRTHPLRHKHPVSYRPKTCNLQ